MAKIHVLTIESNRSLTEINSQEATSVNGGAIRAFVRTRGSYVWKIRAAYRAYKKTKRSTGSCWRAAVASLSNPV